MANKITNPRRIPLEDEFLHHSIDDLVYGYLQYLATFNKDDKKLYATKANVQIAKKDIATLIGKTQKTVGNKINKLEEAGFVKEEMYEGKIVYTFPYDADNNYKIISQEMLFYIISTRNPFAVKLYIWLLDKYDWKKRTNQDGYVFTRKELFEALGYSGNTKPSVALRAIINNNLESFAREGIIEYHEFYEMNASKKVSVPKIRLSFVAGDKALLRKLPNQEHEEEEVILPPVYTAKEIAEKTNKPLFESEFNF